jgi:TolA-binding protein
MALASLPVSNPFDGMYRAGRTSVNRTIRTTTTIVGVVACAAVAALAAGPAFATPTSTPTSMSTSPPVHTMRTLASVQAAAVTETGKRITSLTAAIGKATANTTLSSSDKTTILETLNRDLTGMKAVAAKIAADSTLVQAEADHSTIFKDYRVYAVSLPQSAYAAIAVNITFSASARLTREEARLSRLLSGKDAAKSTTALQAALTDMSAQIDKATNAVSGLSAGVLAVTPEQYNSNHAVLVPFKASVVAARTALKQARSDAKIVRAALK